MADPDIPLRPVPEGWGEDELSKYLDHLRRNHFASFQQRPEWFARLRDLDRLYLKLAANLDNTTQSVPALFFFRAHAAYRAALGLVLAGQVVEAYPLQRNLLEQALYAYFIFRDPARWHTWQARNDSPDAEKQVRSLFKISSMIAELSQAHARDAEVTKQLYDWTIGWGAHPNAFGLFQAISVEETPDSVQFVTEYLHPGTPEHLAALKETARAGVCAFGIFGHIFEPRFTLLRLWDELQPVKAGL